MLYMGIRTWLPPDADLPALFISSYPQNVYRINSYVYAVTAVCVYANYHDDILRYNTIYIYYNGNNY